MGGAGSVPRGVSGLSWLITAVNVYTEFRKRMREAAGVLNAGPSRCWLRCREAPQGTAEREPAARGAVQRQRRWRGVNGARQKEVIERERGLARWAVGRWSRK